MKRIVIDVQLAPCEIGVDIFMPTDRLTKVSDYPHYENEDGNCRGVAMRTEEFPELALVTKPVKATLTIEVPREKGYYWVQLDEEWLIREWTGDNWVSFHGNYYSDDMYNAIIETKIERVPE